jgi:hypothetical protein
LAASEGGMAAAKPIDARIAEAILSHQLDDLEPLLTRNGYDLKSLAEQFEDQTP